MGFWQKAAEMRPFFFVFSPTVNIQAIQKIYEASSNPEKAVGMQSYMKNQFDFLGIQKPRRAEISKPILLWAKTADCEDLMTLCKKLWVLSQREYQYLAMEMMVKGKAWKMKNAIPVLEYFLTEKSWWDTVDMIAAKMVGGYFESYPKEKDKWLEKWWGSNNLWLQRTCIVFQLTYKEKTDHALLFTFCDELKTSKEFFIQKAIGWALRQYARTAPNLVLEFVENHNLKPLSKREALKHF